MARKSLVTMIVASEIAPIWKVTMEFGPDLAVRMDRKEYEAVIKGAVIELKRQIKKVMETGKVSPEK